MKDEFELEIAPGGIITTIYQDGIEDFARQIGADVTSVCRLSNVEWEELDGEKGWTVRAAHNPEHAIRLAKVEGEPAIFPRTQGTLVFYPTREGALEAEARFVWLLLPKKD